MPPKTCRFRDTIGIPGPFERGVVGLLKLPSENAAPDDDKRRQRISCFK